MSILDKIQKENDIKSIEKSQYPELASDIREFLIDKVSMSGGHLASNLGSVELTMALHLCMDFPKDKLIFDVGHQSYTHKILTGRKDSFDSLRQFGGMSGFPKRKESEADCFNTGHSSTSISAAMGYAYARDLRGEDSRVAAVIGDGSLTGGMAYEAINSLAQLKCGCVIILNDNEMSIDKNVGGLSRYLNEIRVSSKYNEIKSEVESSLLNSKAGTRVARTIKKSKDNIKQFFVPGMFFEELGITYLGPIDGHNIDEMVKTFNKAFKLCKPIIIHVKTKKGKGYRYAEKHPSYYHGIGSFDKESGKALAKKVSSSYTDIFAKQMVKMGREHEDIVAITAAMALGTGLSHFGEEFPKRMIDVGIAEQHAVTMAAGLAAANMVPVVAIYSSFLQRAYDQILHDVCMQNLHVIFAIDRSGLVGPDGETHQGIYDISYLSHMPNIVVLAPKNRYELVSMMEFAYEYDGPVAIKYPKDDAYKGYAHINEDIVIGKSEYLQRGSRVSVIAVGSMIKEAEELSSLLEQDGIKPTIVNARFANMVDMEMLEDLAFNSEIIAVMEENVYEGGYCEMVLSKLADMDCHDNLKLVNGSIKKRMVEQGSIMQLKECLAIDAGGIYRKIKNLL